jgi:hypothetical protein
MGDTFIMPEAKLTCQNGANLRLANSDKKRKITLKNTTRDQCYVANDRSSYVVISEMLNPTTKKTTIYHQDSPYGMSGPCKVFTSDPSGTHSRKGLWGLGPNTEKYPPCK